MALNVLLVDDEYLVLKGLEIILSEQTETSVKIVTAMDVEDALNKLTSFRPDVIITDINMPESNGFELIKQAQQNFPHCRFIICSGYDEQSYLKQALHLHVDDYLLKPIDKSLLIHRLKELEVEKERNISHVLMRIQLLLLNGNSYSDDVVSAKDLEYIFPNSAFCLCAINNTHTDPLQLKQQLTRYFDTIYTFSLNSRTLFLLNYSKKIHSEEVYTILETLFKTIPWGHSYFLSTAGKANAINSIAVHYQEALCEMILSQSPASKTEDYSPLLQIIAKRTLLPAIRVITFEENIEDYIQELYNALPANLYYPLIFTEFFSAYTFVSDINLPIDRIHRQYPTPSDNTITQKSLIQFVKKLLDFWHNSFSQTEQESCSSKVAAACRYIKLHYQQDISLDKLAEILTINASYLSYIFKKETGSTIVQYLTNVRMEQACELLCHRPDLTMEEIALQTGYNSTTYFHKIFRSKFGVSPRQWQQTMSEK